MTDSIEAALLAGQQAIQSQLSALERTAGETAQAVRGLVKDNESWAKRVEKLELQVGDLMNSARDRAAYNEGQVAIRKRDKGMLLAAASALTILAAMARDILAAVRSAL